MIIRKCREKDIEEAGAFYDRTVLYLEEHTNYPKWTYGSYPSEGYVREMYSRGNMYLCFRDGDIAAAFVLDDDPEDEFANGTWPTGLRNGEYLVIHAMAVDRSAGRSGIGTEILGFCEREARDKGYRALRVDVVPDNHPAKAFYEKNGFVYTGDADLKRGIEYIPLFSLYEKEL